MPKRTDQNQASLARELRALGFSVADLHLVGRGVPDLAVGGLNRRTWQRETHLVEVKNGQGALTEREAEFHAEWNGSPIIIAREPLDVLRAFGWEA